jgi:hypothetical protein
MVPYLLNASHRAFGPGLTANVQCLPDGYEARGLIGVTMAFTTKML